MRNTFTDAIITAALEHEDIFVLAGDAGLGVFDDFSKQRPQQFMNTGVAEQNAIGLAAGLAKTGFRVFIYNIIPFVMYRCYEQVRNDVCYQNLPVILAGYGAGLTYAPAGMTHYAVEDLGLAQTLPNLQVFSPVDPMAVSAVAEYSLQATGPTYIRLGKRGEPNLHKQTIVDVTQPEILASGEQMALLTHGAIADEVMQAQQQLQEIGVQPRVIALNQLFPLQLDALMPLLEGVQHVVVIEEHFKGTGLAAALAAQCHLKGMDLPMVSLGIEDAFVHQVTDQAGMRRYFKLDVAAIVAAIKELL